MGSQRARGRVRGSAYRAVLVAFIVASLMLSRWAHAQPGGVDFTMLQLDDYSHVWLKLLSCALLRTCLWPDHLELEVFRMAGASVASSEVLMLVYCLHRPPILAQYASS
jgi:hypothetical protein